MTMIFLSALLFIGAVWAIVHGITRRDIAAHRETERKRVAYGESKFASPAERVKFTAPAVVATREPAFSDSGKVSGYVGHSATATRNYQYPVGMLDRAAWGSGQPVGIGNYAPGRFVVPRRPKEWWRDGFEKF